ncbi:hypothetical protein Hdeb2414_s0013g00404251 [Helianthus debilis subsp. tardiflorus]
MESDEWLFTLRFIIFLVQCSSPLSSDQKSFRIIIIFIIRLEGLIMEEGSSSKFKKICVFCGSHSGHREVFSVAATQFG